jgi:hypothetical protein
MYEGRITGFRDPDVPTAELGRLMAGGADTLDDQAAGPDEAPAAPADPDASQTAPAQPEPAATENDQ